MLELTLELLKLCLGVHLILRVIITLLVIKILDQLFILFFQFAVLLINDLQGVSEGSLDRIILIKLMDLFWLLLRHQKVFLD